MRSRLTLMIAAATVLTGAAVDAADPAQGESDFKRCRSCHAITAPDGTDIQKGGKIGPNLYGVIGRVPGSQDGFKYSDSLVAAGEAGIVWDQENLAVYIQDPTAWLKEVLDDPSAKSGMTFKHRKGAEDMAAYLASVGDGS